MTVSMIQLSLLSFAVCMNVGCAKSPRKIIAGSETVDIPYQVSIQIRPGENFCGGTILDDRHILTAAHCILDDDRNPYNTKLDVVVGTTDKDDRKSGNVFQIEGVMVHEGYDPHDSRRNDIAILKLKKRITFNANQSAIKLPINDTTKGTAVMSSGWGALLWSELNQEGDAYPRYLQYYYGEVIGQEECQRRMTPEIIHPEHICVLAEGRSTACQGDDGGPLTDGSSIVGITSFNNDCDPLYPDVYTRVYKYVDWIKNLLDD